VRPCMERKVYASHAVPSLLYSPFFPPASFFPSSVWPTWGRNDKEPRGLQGPGMGLGNQPCAVFRGLDRALGAHRALCEAGGAGSGGHSSFSKAQEVAQERGGPLIGLQQDPGQLASLLVPTAGPTACTGGQDKNQYSQCVREIR
jgi:hypothetical protein